MLGQLGYTVEITSVDVEETYPDDMPVEQVPEYLAQKKANAYEGELDTNDVLVTADTIVVLNGRIYEKPTDRDDAINILQQLSGNMHRVITGVNLRSADKEVQFSVTTEVYFKPLEQQEITRYIDTFQPFDKAGGYAIQEWLGMIGIEKINGCYFNVVGLPLSALYGALKDF